MDVLRPKLLWIDNRCYRVNPIGLSESTQSNCNYAEEDEYQAAHDEYADEVCDAFSNVEELKHGGYRLALEIPTAYYGFLIGRGGETKKRLESETNTQIKFPKQGYEGDIVISGSDKKGVLSAQTRINILVDTAKQKQPFTHFLSLPVAGNDFKDKLNKFRKQVLDKCKEDRGVDETIFQNPQKLHMTIGTMALMDRNEKQRAQSVLEECVADKILPIINKEPLRAHFKGLEYMNDDPSEVDVIYAKCSLLDHSNRLQTISDILAQTFTMEGIMKKDFDRVKLHVTVMNSLMRKDGGVVSPRSRSEGKPRESFDASTILQVFKDFDFGVHLIDVIHISQRHVTGSSGYYGCEYSVDLSPT